MITKTGRLRIGLACVAGSLSFGGCDVLAPDKVCILIPEPALRIDVRDAASGVPVPGIYEAVATDRTFADTADVMPFASDTVYHGPFALALDRPGTYAVEVDVAGYLE